MMHAWHSPESIGKPGAQRCISTPRPFSNILPRSKRSAGIGAATSRCDLRVRAIKAYQQRRFIHTYDDLLKHPRYSAAARFFLDELYGPKDFTDRDTQFARVVPALVRLFPQDIVDVVGLLAELHALSEQLDTAMAEHLDGVRVDAPAYIAAWQATGAPAQRAAADSSSRSTSAWRSTGLCASPCCATPCG